MTGPERNSLILCAILASVAYSTARTTEQFEIRLADGELGLHEGRLEVNHGGNWGMVTDTGWGVEEADVVCRQLGFHASFPAAVGHRFPVGLTMSVLDKVKCHGNEIRLDECDNLGWNVCSGDCSSDKEVGVRCIMAPMPDAPYQLRLTGSASQFEGLVEVRYNEDWGPLCAAGFKFSSAITVCHQLRFGPPKHRRALSREDQDFRTKLIFSVECSGGQMSLLDCNLNGEVPASCGPSDRAAYVSCNSPTDPYPLVLDSTSYQYEGTVQIYSAGQFGTVCDAGWDLNAADVVCRQLGYGTAIDYHGNSHYGPSPDTQPILLSSVRCTGRESLLAECSHSRFGVASCSHQHEASVLCNDPELKDYTLRIVGGNAYQGTLEVAQGGLWLAVCQGSSWDLRAANVSCRQMGLGPAQSASSAFPSELRFALWSDVKCAGTEDSLDQCTTSEAGQHQCPDGELARLTCSTPGMPHQKQDEIRLAGGILPYEGAIQVRKNGTWQAVCRAGWDPDDALVACRQLGYRGAVDNPAFTTEGRFYMDSVECEGSELTLTSCRHSVLEYGASCRDLTGHAGVTCNPFGGVLLPSGATSLRLVGGQTPSEGQVEVYFDGAWGGVCGGANWSMNAAHVACRQLGYEQAVATNIQRLQPGIEKRSVMEDVDCIGTELMLSACSHGPWQQGMCPSTAAATVDCKDIPTDNTGMRVSPWVYVAVAVLLLAIVVIGVACIIRSVKKRKNELRVREGPSHPDVRHEALDQDGAEASENKESVETRID